jgi:hypothetical protein
VVSNLGGDSEGNYGDCLTLAAMKVMERWTNYGGENGDGAKLQVRPAMKHGGETWRCDGGVERGVGGAGARWR